MVRVAAGLSQKELASMLYISQQAYAKYELGTASPNPDTLSKISLFLHVSVDSLLNCENDTPENVDIKIGLRYFREQKQLTQENLATMLGITVETIRLYENGIAIPDYRTLQAISDALDVQVEALFYIPYELLMRELSFEGLKYEERITEKEFNLISAYRKSSAADREIIDNIVSRYRPPRTEIDSVMEMTSDNDVARHENGEHLISILNTIEALKEASHEISLNESFTSDKKNDNAAPSSQDVGPDSGKADSQ